MRQHILIKTTPQANESMINALTLVLGMHLEIREKDSCIWLDIDEITEEELESIFQSLESDLNLLISFYHTTSDQYDRELALVCSSFLQSTYGHYNLKSFIPQIKSKSLARELFHFITDGTGIDERIIFSMAESDLNVSQASISLYMHRNTLLYKIERLEELRGFDIKKFYDLYLLFYLLKA